MSRLQLAHNVSNLDDAINFYSKFFKCEPSKVRPGYANFAIPDPPLKLVLFEGGGVPGSINHLGVEVGSPDAVTDATSWLASQGMETKVETATACCYAVQDKVWVQGPDGSDWEVYTVLGDVAPTPSLDARCCSTTTNDSDESATSACC